MLDIVDVQCLNQDITHSAFLQTPCELNSITVNCLPLCLRGFFAFDTNLTKNKVFESVAVWGEGV